MEAKHTSKAVISMLNQGGIVMSYSWTKKALSNLSADIRNQMLLSVASKPIVVVHDNIKLKYGVRSQRGDNQTVSDNGTAISVFILPDSACALENSDEFDPLRRRLKAQRIAGTSPRLSWGDLAKTDRLIRLRTAFIYDIIDIFRMILEFSGSNIWKAGRLKRPTGPNQLPHGPEHRLVQYMLPTTNIEEQTYSGNIQVVNYAMKELGLSTGDNLTRLVLSRQIIWPGDQMTADRCRTDQRFRQESRNGYERWEPFIFIFGGLYCQMALGSSIIDGHRGANVGPTFGGDIILTSRVGLQLDKNHKRPDFHTADEFLLHEAEAHFRGLLAHVTGCDTSEKFTTWIAEHTADDLYEIAAQIHRHHASSTALSLKTSDDKQRHGVILRGMDLLLYSSVRRAYKWGDVDSIEDLMPELLFYFIGAGNSHYAKEVFEFLQLITHEVTPGTR
jgi:hypothetical protein